MKYIITINYPGCEARTFAHTSAFDKPETVLEEIFAAFNHGSGKESELFLKSKMRSLSVHDFVRVNTQWYQCKSVGWEKVAEEFVDNIEKAVVDHPKYALYGGWFCLSDVMWTKFKRIS